VLDGRSDFTQPRSLYGDISPQVQWTPVLLSEALLAHYVYVCLERLSGALPPEVMSPRSRPACRCPGSGFRIEDAGVRLVFKAHRRLYHSTLDLRAIKKKKNGQGCPSSEREKERIIDVSAAVDERVGHAQGM